ncbi:hypothetical protein ABLE91_01750 [Aquabacter sp. CN5-332]|uniref:hypothetical protein n=1 Tax=Aquabacter sp. CN5-332 TaxID=3156608 RepID=UPI0032B319F1
MHAIARHLPDFTTSRTPAPELPASPGFSALFTHSLRPAPSVSSGAAEPPAAPGPDIAELTREAAERGRREGEAAARAEFERLRAEDEVRFAERLEAERATWSEVEAARLAGAMEAAIAEMEAGMAESLARIVSPFLEAGVRERALAELEGLMVPILAREDRPVLKISGAADLLERLRARLGDPPACVFEPADMADVRVVVGETVLETQVRAWVDRLNPPKV